MHADQSSNQLMPLLISRVRLLHVVPSPRRLLRGSPAYDIF